MMDPPANTPVTPVTPISGIIVVDKPEGVSSMGVCRVVRGKLRTGGAPKRIKVGHGGTLDPLATGVLVILVGKATKLCHALSWNPRAQGSSARSCSVRRPTAR